jgi:hypothetical protein
MSDLNAATRVGIRPTPDHGDPIIRLKDLDERVRRRLELWRPTVLALQAVEPPPLGSALAELVTSRLRDAAPHGEPL